MIAVIMIAVCMDTRVLNNNDLHWCFWLFRETLRYVYTHHHHHHHHHSVRASTVLYIHQLISQSIFRVGTLFTGANKQKKKRKKSPNIHLSIYGIFTALSVGGGGVKGKWSCVSRFLI